MSAAYRPDIDGLRALAILPVVAFHVAPDRMPAGFIGVDIFFVISGYLITTILLGNLQRNTFSLADFYARRIVRIFPALVLVLTATLALGWMLFLCADFQAVGRHVTAGVLFVSNFALWSEAGYFASPNNALLHLWSLAVEEQFYILWPLLLWLLWGKRYCLPVLLTLCVGSFACTLWLVQTDPTAAFYCPVTRAWELLVGGLIAWAQVSRFGIRVGTTPPYVAHAASLAGFTGILVGLLCINPGLQFPGWWALLPVLGAALLIIAGPQACINRLLAHRALVYVGLVSYPLYLWHWPLLVFSKNIVTPHTRLLKIGMVLLSVLLAILTYHGVEKPARAYRLRSGARRITTGLITAMLLLAALGGLVWYAQGIPARFPAAVRSIAAFHYPAQLDREWRRYRKNTCFFDQAARVPVDYHAECVDAARPQDTRPLLVLWGDSHAAQYYDSLHAVQQSIPFCVAQFTGGCLPILGFDIAGSANCRAHNDMIAQKIAQLQPHIVMLAASWSGTDVQNLEKIQSTLAFLNAHHVPRIVVVGPLPLWEQGLATTLVSYMMAHNLSEPPPYMQYGLRASVADADRILAAQSQQAGVRYGSVLEFLCNAEGCRTIFDQTPLGLSAYDSSHLSRPAADYVIERLTPLLFR